MPYISDSYRYPSVDVLRIPTALMLAVLLTGTLFWCLWSVTNVTMVLPQLVAHKIDFTPKLKDKEIIKEPVVTSDRVPPPVTPTLFNLPNVGNDQVIPGPNSIPTLGPTKPEFRKNLPLRTDSEVMPLVRVNPEYPPSALDKGIEGWVQVRFTVTGAGTVKDAVVVKSSARVFESNALKAILRWRYNPKVENGVGIERVGLETIIKFELQN